MKYLSTFLLITLMSVYPIFAENGDTIVVQTIDFDTPLLPGWNNPRSGKYQFPPDTVSFSKILMSYRLKCDQSQSPACGEWDYTTHTKVWEHTGVYDSNLYYHPNYIVNNQSPDSTMLMLSTSYKYTPLLEYSNQTIPTNTAEPGSGDQEFTIPFDQFSTDGKSQFIFSSDNLISSGLQIGDITGLQLNVTDGSIDVKHLAIRIAHTNLNSLPAYSYVEDDFTTVYNSNTTLETTSSYINFAFPFNWDGSQNIIIEISYVDYSGSAIMQADAIGFGDGIISGGKDYFLDFEGWDYINVPKEVFNTIDSAVTISFWQYGNPEIQPINSSIFEGVDSLGRRVLNAHLPWSNGKVYWDAGFDGSDRIVRQASPNEFEGKWNFWTFIKDSRSGSMQILLNGNLWFIGNGRTKPMINIEEFRIGAAITFDGYYSGMIDDFRIWDTILSWTEVAEWMYKDISTDHPKYSHLKANYKFNNGEGFDVTDSSPNNYHASQFGYPQWMNYQGVNRFRNSIENISRPHLVIENGNYNSALLDSIVVVDTTELAPVIVVLYNPDNPPQPIDTLTRWLSYYNNYQYNAGGIAIDSTLVPPEEIIYLEDMPYYGAPYEVLIPWEIGRFITPYGNNLSLGNDGFTWVYDVTDYRTLLYDSVHITAGNFQELLDLEFHMIEGTPSREVLKIDKIYTGYYYLNTFEETVSPDTIPLLPEAETFRVKTRTSGHLFDNPTNCAEFCDKLHSVDINGQTAREWQIIQECSDNPLYPQGGTWIYDRAGWCPGMKVEEQDIEVTSFIDGDTAIVDYNSQPDQYGNYVLETHLFSYSAPNFSLDAAVDEIIAPNKLKRYERFNPSASAPVIVISNNGSTTLTSLNITYGPIGKETTFEWTGDLEFTENEEVILESFQWEEWIAGSGSFSVKISNPNGETDENTINDNYFSDYELPDMFPSTIVIHLKTNKVASQNNYEILTNTGVQLFEKGNFENETLYIDTLTLLNGCYDFYLWDSGDNGISFWANNEGSGTLKFYDLEGNVLKNFNGDFGDRIYHSFYTDIYLDTYQDNANEIAFEIIPNPNQGNFTLSYALSEESNIRISIFNSNGLKVKEIDKPGMLNEGINVSMMNAVPGVYSCIISTQKHSIAKKFVITR
jgi:concanavalin A-like lectin/glucanase superfamily protein/peptide-N-glycosidase F-like protein/type IX secretion system substrate protein